MRRTKVEIALDMVAARTSACVIWPGRVDRNGYGLARWDGNGKRAAHRVIYELITGSIPAGMTLDHLCFTPACINPDHLAPRSMVENARRQRSAEKSHCVRGHEFTPENTYLKSDRSNGRRACRACGRENTRAYLARKKRTA